MQIHSTRAGMIQRNMRGYEAFVPAPLPPTNPPLAIDASMQKLLSEADRKLGKLDGITQILPNPQLFVAMYVKKEAVLSAQIEGTQASLVDVLDAPLAHPGEYSRDGVAEVVNYVNAMYSGLQRLNEFPLSLRLIREIHEKLLDGVRGANKNPGEFRRSQNWIGVPGCTLENAAFVPPTPEDMNIALSDLEKFFYAEDDLLALIKIALIHAQFETIHPFLDGNGRMGRLLITFWLCQQRILEQPLLYISYYFKQNRAEYYDRLMAVRTNGDWENWIRFFLRAIAATADEATESAKQIFALRTRCQSMLSALGQNNGKQEALLDLLFEHPVLTKIEAAELLNVSYPTVSGMIDNFCSIGILEDLQPDKKRYKKYAFRDYLAILQRGTDVPEKQSN